jgi:zinc protease
MISLGLLVLITALGSPLARAQEDAKFNYAEKTLSNGLKVVALEDFGTPIVAVQVWYHVGSKNENPERQGFAHMFEHMMFRGTDKLGPKGHMELIRQVGGDCNAYTFFDQTVYVEKLPSNQLDLALWLEAERMAFLKIDQDSFSTERSVVEEERRQGINGPYGTVLEKVLPQVFGQHPYRWAPIGQIPHLRKASVDELARFWETYYVPNNATLVVVGAVKKEDVFAKAEKLLSWVPRGKDVQQVTYREPQQTEPKVIQISEPKGPLTITGVGFRTVPMNSPDAPALEVLGTILGSGESSRLYQLLVKQKDIATAAESATFTLEQDGIFGAFAVLKPMGGYKKDEVLKLISGEIDRLKTEPVSAEELEKAKLNLVKSQVIEAQTVENRAKLLGTYAVLYGDLSRINTRFDEIRNVTAADLQRVANTYLIPSHQDTLIVEPAGFGEMLKSMSSKGQDEGPPASRPAGNPSPARQGPKATAVRPASFPTTAPVAPVLDTVPDFASAEKVLPNGLKVVVLPNRQIPLVTLTLGIKSGSATETPGHFGEASMAANLLTQGTAHYDAKALADELDRHAISLGGSAGTDVSSVDASCLPDQADLAGKLFAEVLLRPTFPEKEFEQAREQELSGLSVSEQNPKFLAGRELNKAVYGDHPYGRSTSAEDVKAIKRENVAAWWSTHVRPDNSVLYVAGDMTPEAAFALAEKYLGDWRATGEAPVAPKAALPERHETTIYLIDKPGLVQSEIRFGELSINRQDPRWPAARVLTQIFGGQFGSRLMETVRIKKGLTYGIYGGFQPQKDAGLLEIETFSKTPTTAETIAATIDEIKRMKSDPIEPQELTTAKNFLVGSFASRRETPQDLIGELWLIEYSVLPKDFTNRVLSGTARTEESDVRALARDQMDEKNLTIVVVGDAKKVRADLEKIAKVVVVKPDGTPVPEPTGTPTTKP